MFLVHYKNIYVLLSLSDVVQDILMLKCRYICFVQAMAI